MSNTPHQLIIRGRGLRRYYQRGVETVKALDGVDIDIRTAEMVSIVGPSGSGKTTLVNLLSCLDAPTAGELNLNGKSIAGLAEDHLAGLRRGQLGFIFQKFHLTLQRRVEGCPFFEFFEAAFTMGAVGLIVAPCVIFHQNHQVGRFAFGLRKAAFH